MPPPIAALRASLSALALFLILTLGLGPGAAQAQITDINAAINKAGRERMLSQRIAKAYFQLGLGAEPERSRAVLDSSITLFEQQLAELKQYAPTPDIQATYGQLETAWIAYKGKLRTTPTPAIGREVLALSENVLALAHKGTAQLEARSGSTAGRLVNLAGRQRMLSQRLAKLYQATAWGIQDTRATEDMAQARREFSAAHRELSAEPANTAQIQEALKLAGQQWIFFEHALEQRPGPRGAAEVATTSERILSEMEIAVGRYETLTSKSVKQADRPDSVQVRPLARPAP